MNNNTKKYGMGGAVQSFSSPMLAQGMQGGLSGFGTSGLQTFADGGQMTDIERILAKYKAMESTKPKEDETSEFLRKSWEGKNLDDYIMYSDKYKRGGKMAKGGQTASIGDSGIITDKNSMFVGKMATITGKFGNMFEVRVGDRTSVVKKNAINIISDEFANGGEVGNFRGIDLFEDYEMQEPKLRKIVQKINDAYDEDEINTQFLNERLNEAEAIGYTFEIDMDGSAYGLRPQNVDITEIEGFEEEYGKGGKTKAKKSKNDAYVVYVYANSKVGDDPTFANVEPISFSTLSKATEFVRLIIAENISEIDKVEVFSKSGQRVQVWNNSESDKNIKEKYLYKQKIPNNYQGKSAEKVWSLLTPAQRSHYLEDHENGEYKNLVHSDWNELNDRVRNGFEMHVQEGQYAKGGKLKKGQLKKPQTLYKKLGDAEMNWKKDNGEEYHKIEKEIEENRKLYFELLGQAEMNGRKDNLAEYHRLMLLRNQFGKGGEIAEGNYEMMLSQAKEVQHHVNELENILKGEKEIEAWVVAKMENVSSTLSDITHYLDGKTEYAKGGKTSSQKIYEVEYEIGGKKHTSQFLMYDSDRVENLLPPATKIISIKEKFAKGGEVGEEKYYYFAVSYSHAPRNQQKLSERTWRGVWAKSEKEAIKNVKQSIRLEYKNERPPHVFDKIYPNLLNVLTLKEYVAQEARYHKEQQERMNPKEYAKGGKVGFEGLAKKVAKRYVGKKVSKEYQAEYGKTYDAKEAKEVGNKVAGKVYQQQVAKKKIVRKLQRKTK
jgi:hypothetical protein